MAHRLVVVDHFDMDIETDVFRFDKVSNCLIDRNAWAEKLVGASSDMEEFWHRNCKGNFIDKKRFIIMSFIQYS